jgi:hypothetical protein
MIDIIPVLGSKLEAEANEALLNECMNSGSPSLAGKGLGVRSAQSPREIDLSLNPSPTGEGL